MHSIRRAALELAILGSILLVPLETFAAPEAPIPSQPKVAESAARATALARVKGGIVQRSELEREAGKLVWSFDIERPGSKNVTEILVDANTGRIVSKKQETPAEQAKETQADKVSK
jgi:Peptidase propeptide and YPEB domain